MRGDRTVYCMHLIRRTGILLIGGDKTGNPNWYQEYVPRADAIYAQHLKEIEKDPIY